MLYLHNYPLPSAAAKLKTDMKLRREGGEAGASAAARCAALDGNGADGGVRSMRMADTLFYCTCLLTATIIGMEVSLSITAFCVRKSARTPYLDTRLQDGSGA